MNDPFLDLAPARWIWLPGQRTLQNTVALFRREVVCAAPPRRATGWIVADSRYRLLVNGERTQWGPAPSDPRDQEVDPLDLTACLVAGRNVLAIEVLFYGTGDGTWPMGSPGLLLRLDIEHADGRLEQIISDEKWRCQVDRAWAPGQYKRWYLRALQEIVDARRHPHGWQNVGYDDRAWLPAAVLPGSADRPALIAGAADYLFDAGVSAIDPTSADVLKNPRLRRRTIPLMNEAEVLTCALHEAGTVAWHRDPDDWFEYRLAGTLTATHGPIPAPDIDGSYTVPTTPIGHGSLLTFVLPIHSLGWPQISITAPPGTIIDLMFQEGHDPVNGPAWLETGHYEWSRYICRGGGREDFEAFDFESLRWIQLHIRNPDGPVQVHHVGLRQRMYAWSEPAVLRSSEPALNRLFAAAINTLDNSAQDLIYDGAGRERQQYSGDVGHQLVTIRHLRGERALPARFLRTFSEGQTHEGFFLDCWPAYDRLNRMAQRTMGMTPWGPLLDHGVGFVFDHYQHWFETADLEAGREAWPRLVRQLDYLERLVRPDGLLPVEDLGLPAVWIDHHCFPKQRHKQCPFNLYTAAMLTHALAPLALARGDASTAQRATALGARLLATTQATFWNAELGLFVDNQPWLREESALVTRRDRAPYLRPRPRHGGSVWSNSWRRHHRHCPRTRRDARPLWGLVPGQCGLALPRLGRARPGRRGGARPARTLGHQPGGHRELRPGRGLGPAAR